MDWLECNKKRIVKGVSIDFELIESLIKSSKNKSKSELKLELDEVTVGSKISLLYDSLREILEALALKNKFKIYNHECYTAFLKEVLNENEKSEEFEELRKIRNNVNYYGKGISVDEAKGVLKRLKNLREKILKLFLKINCIIVHGCPSNAEKAMNEETRTYDKHWIPWTKEQLISKGIEVETPLMPEPWKPNYNKFKEEFEKYEVNEDSVLIGHSCGCAFLVRWLGETKQKIDKLILVAPWKIPDENDEHRKEFYIYPIDESIRERINKIVMFTADDEGDDGKKSLKIYNKFLGGKIIELKGHGHYTMGDMGTTEFPELIEEIIN